MSDPYCLAMILCDNIHKDSTTGKQTILGTFSTVGAHEFPTKLRFAVYYAITDLEGEKEIQFRLVDSSHSFDESSQAVFEVKVMLKCPSPLAVMEGGVLVNAVEIPKAGVYHCELLCEGNVLMSRRLIAIRPDDLQGETL